MKEIIKKLLYLPFHILYFLFYFIMFLIPFLIIFGIYGIAFTVGLGLSGMSALIIIVLSLVGSIINVPLFYVAQTERIVETRYVKFMGITWAIPIIRSNERKTLIAANVGGCIIPVIFSIYLFVTLVSFNRMITLIKIAVGTIIDAVIINRFAKPIKGVGIATPMLVPAIITAALTIILAPIGVKSDPFVMAYIMGTFGILIGADIMNLDKIHEIGAPVASIGGAGTFDGVFMNGIFSILVLLLISLF